MDLKKNKNKFDLNMKIEKCYPLPYETRNDSLTNFLYETRKKHKQLLGGEIHNKQTILCWKNFYDHVKFYFMTFRSLFGSIKPLVDKKNVL